MRLVVKLYNMELSIDAAAPTRQKLEKKIGKDFFLGSEDLDPLEFSVDEVYAIKSNNHPMQGLYIGAVVGFLTMALIGIAIFSLAGYIIGVLLDKYWFYEEQERIDLFNNS